MADELPQLPFWNAAHPTAGSAHLCCWAPALRRLPAERLACRSRLGGLLSGCSGSCFAPAVHLLVLVLSVVRYLGIAGTAWESRALPTICNGCLSPACTKEFPPLSAPTAGAVRWPVRGRPLHALLLQAHAGPGGCCFFYYTEWLLRLPPSKLSSVGVSSSQLRHVPLLTGPHLPLAAAPIPCNCDHATFLAPSFLQPLTYEDIEAVDPDFFKNLK